MKNKPTEIKIKNLSKEEYKILLQEGKYFNILDKYYFVCSARFDDLEQFGMVRMIEKSS